MNDLCKALLESIEKLQKSNDVRIQAANALELKRLKKAYEGACALQTQFVATFDGTLKMVTRVPEFKTLVPSPFKLKLAFNDLHTSVNPLKAALMDPPGRTLIVLSASAELGMYEKGTGRLTLPASIRIDHKGNLAGLSSVLLSTDSANELGRGSRMDEGKIQLVGSGTFEKGSRWQNNTFGLLIAGTVDPVP
jgi:hypothetical protein